VVTKLLNECIFNPLITFFLILFLGRFKLCFSYCWDLLRFLEQPTSGITIGDCTVANLVIVSFNFRCTRTPVWILIFLPSLPDFLLEVPICVVCGHKHRQDDSSCWQETTNRTHLCPEAGFSDSCDLRNGIKCQWEYLIKSLLIIVVKTILFGFFLLLLGI